MKPAAGIALGAAPVSVGERAGLLVLAAYAFCALWVIPIFPHGGSVNELTRWATDASLVERGGFDVAWIQPLVGEIVDTATLEGHLYSNKPPGAALLGLPGYLLARPFVGAPDAANIRISWTLMRWCVSTIPMILFGYVLLRRGASPLQMLAALFGTLLFLYSFLLFSHVLTGLALFGAYRLVFGRAGGGHGGGPGAREALLAGALCGLCVLSEFTTIVGVAILGVGLVFLGWSRSGSDQADSRVLPRSAGNRGAARAGSKVATSRSQPAQSSSRITEAAPSRRPFATILAFVLGGLPFAAVLALYNVKLFGSPFATSYAHESFQAWAEVAEQGVFGISWPKPANFWLLLASPSRGLLFYSPILILSLAGLFSISGADALRRRVRLAVVIAGVLLLSGHGAAHGGWAAGPRYILFIVPFLIEPLLERDWFGSWPVLAGALLGLSLVLGIVPALTFPFAPHEYTFPHNTFWAPLLRQEGWATPTLGALLGLGSGPIALIPFIAAIVMAIAAALRDQMRRMEASAGRLLPAGLAGGIVLATVYCAFPGFDDVEARIHRATVAERFYKPAGRLEPFRSLATDPSQLRLLEGMLWMDANAWTHAPSNWPYGNEPLAKLGPSEVNARAVELQKQGKRDEARDLLRSAQEQFPFARCDFSDQLGIVLYTSGRKDEAMRELESARSLVPSNYGSSCRMVLFHLASLETEMGRIPDAIRDFRDYLASTEGDQTQLTLRSRETARQALAKLEAGQ